MTKKIIFNSLVAIAMVAMTACGPKEPVEIKPDYSGLTEVTFTESDKDFPNPERGFYTQKQFYSNRISSSYMTDEVFESERLMNRTVVRIMFYLNTYFESPIEQAYLDMMQANFDAMRRNGSKAVIRFAYNDSMDFLDKPWDAPIERVHQHIDQVKPILLANADVILCMEAGFIGSWGEWYYTDNFGFNPSPSNTELPGWKNRRELVNKLLECLPKDRQINIRYPSAKLAMYKLTIADSITLKTAHNGSDVSRLASHNDCFVSSSNDVGTYKNESEREYLYAETRYTINEGETCKLSDHSKAERVIGTMEDHHLTALNISYNATVINRWRDEGVFDQISKRMGYRLVLDKALFTPEPTVGGDFRCVLFIDNVGFASPMNPRKAELVAISTADASKKYTIALDTDPRFWFASTVTTVDKTVTLPTDMAAGSYKLYLNLPDGYASLQNNPLFSIRLANEQVWDEKLGMNLLTTIQVK